MEPRFLNAPVPDHVGVELVRDFDYFHPPGIAEGDVYAAWKRLHDGPDIFWTTRNGGHWVLTRAVDIKWVQENHEVFSHKVFTIPRPAAPIHMPPLTVDPPMHAPYRSIINPAFTPKRIASLGDQARELTIKLVQDLKPRGECEFVAEFARIMPVTVFLGIVELPLERREEFAQWAVSYISATVQSEKDHYLAQVVRYLSGVLHERARANADDLLSRIVRSSTGKLAATPEDVMGMALLVFFGGLDTVANMLSFATIHLATHPEHRLRLRQHPEFAPQAAEEYIRRHGLSNTGRLVTRSIDYKGVHFAEDDMVMVPIAMSSMDEREYPNPLDIDFDRGPVAHNTFGNGPHRCVGALLARTELRIFLEEWLRYIPDFDLDSRQAPITHSGSVNGVSRLNLIWGV